MNGCLIFDAHTFSDVRIYPVRSTMLLTILRPVRFPANYQVCSDDYVSLSHIETRGTWSVDECSRFTVTDTTDPSNVDLFQSAFRQKGKKNDSRSR